jgi:chromosome partitioning protein
MIITVANFKGGTGKTVSAIHLAAYLQQKAPTLLIDGDVNRSATAWAKRGQLPFKVVDERGAAKYARNFEHIVVDTQARPSAEDLRALADGCDMMILPTPPDMVSIDPTLQLIDLLKEMGVAAYRVLLTMAPPKPRRDAEEARVMFNEQSVPILESTIRRLVAFEKAGLFGVPVYEVKDARAQEGWQDYVSVGEELLK